MSHLFHNSQFHANFNYPTVYVRCTIFQMFNRLRSVSDITLTFDVTVTTNSGHLNEHYTGHVFVFIGILCSAAIIWLCITDGSSTCCHSPPWSVRRLRHTHWSYVHLQRTKSWNKLRRSKCAVLLMYSYILHLSHTWLPIVFRSDTSKRGKHCQRNWMLIYSPTSNRWINQRIRMTLPPFSFP
jgi:hypothetical protein